MFNAYIIGRVSLGTTEVILKGTKTEEGVKFITTSIHADSENEEFQANSSTAFTLTDIDLPSSIPLNVS